MAQKLENGAGPGAAKFFVCFLRKRHIFANLWGGGTPRGSPSQEELLLGKRLTRRIATWEASHKKNCYLASLSQEELLLGKPLTRRIATGKPFTRRIATWQAPTRRNATKHRPGGPKKEMLMWASRFETTDPLRFKYTFEI